MKVIIRIGLSILAVIVILPIYFTFVQAFSGVREIELNMGGILSGRDELALVPLVPLYPSLSAFQSLLLFTKDFYRMFWNTCIQALPAAGWLLSAAPAAYVLAKKKFRGRNFLFWLYVILMLMPFQVTMVTEYFVLQRLHILDTHLAVSLPMVFSAFPVFILSRIFGTIDQSILEAAKIDGAGEVLVFTKIILPIGKGGVVSVIMLGILESIHAVEQPLVFIKDKLLHPLSLFFPDMNAFNAGGVFAASAMILISFLLLFMLGEEHIETGIQAVVVKL